MTFDSGKTGPSTNKLLSLKENFSFMIFKGKPVWIREESLASILAVEMVDLPVSESEARMEEQFGSAGSK